MFCLAAGPLLREVYLQLPQSKGFARQSAVKDVIIWWPASDLAAGVVLPLPSPSWPVHRPLSRCTVF